MTVADTDVLIDYLAGKGEAGKVERLLQRAALWTTVITRYELLCGTKTPKQADRMAQLLEAVPSLELDEAAVDAAAGIQKSLQQAGHGIGMADSLIAGIVISKGGILFTRNRRHFERIPGLELA